MPFVTSIDCDRREPISFDGSETEMPIHVTSQRLMSLYRANRLLAGLIATAGALLIGFAIGRFLAVGEKPTLQSQFYVSDKNQLYVSHMNLAQAMWELGRVGETARLLDLYRPVAGQASESEDLRSFEWFYWDRCCHHELLTLKVPIRSGGVVFSPDWQRLATASNDAVRVWDVVTGQELLTLKGHSKVAFSPDGKRLASAGNEFQVKVWDASTGQELLTLKHNNTLTCVAFSPDGGRLVSVTYDSTKVWDLASGQELFTLGASQSVAFSPDGKRLAFALWGGHDTVKVLEAATGKELISLQGHTDRVNSMAYSPDGNWLASASEDQTIRVWDAVSGQETLTLRGHTGDIWSVAFSPDGKRLASRSGGVIKVWDAAADQESLSLTLKGHSGRFTSFSPDGKRLALAKHFLLPESPPRTDGTISVWDTVTGEESLTLKGNTGGEVASVAFSPDGKRIAAAIITVRMGHPPQTSPGEVKVWDATTGQELTPLKDPTGTVQSVAFSPDGKRLALGSVEGAIQVFDAVTGQELFTLKGDTGWVQSVVFSADGTRLAAACFLLRPDSSGYERTIRVLDAVTGQELLTQQGYIVAFSPDGKRLFAMSDKQTIKVWDAATGQELLTLKGDFGEVTSLVFSPDGKRLASVLSRDNTVKLFDAATGQESLSLVVRGKTSMIKGVVFSQDGQRLSADCADGTITVWDATPRPRTDPIPEDPRP